MELVRSPSLWSTFLKNNGYILHDLIGTGSFGDVFAVTKSAVGVKMAMKRIVVRGKVQDDKYVMAEIEALMMFDHPHIVTLEEFFTRKNLACIILEIAPGGNLEMMISAHDSKVSEAFIKIAFHQLLSAVNYCHGLGFAHRDINPSNILVFNDNLVKLADFGLCCRCVEENTRKPIMCMDYLGQETYLAPEVKLYKPFHSKPADVWSVGCILFFMVNRVNPPNKETELFQLLEMAQNEQQTLKEVNNFKQLYSNVMKRTITLNVSDRIELPQLIALWNI